MPGCRMSRGLTVKSLPNKHLIFPASSFDIVAPQKNVDPNTLVLTINESDDALDNSKDSRVRLRSRINHML